MAYRFAGNRIEDLNSGQTNVTLAKYFDGDYVSSAMDLQAASPARNLATINLADPCLGQVHFMFYNHTPTNASDTGLDGNWVRFQDSGGHTVAMIGLLDSSLRAWVDGTGTPATGSLFNVNSSVKYRIDVILDINATDITMELYVDTVLVSTATQANTDARGNVSLVVFDFFDAAIGSDLRQAVSEVILADEGYDLSGARLGHLPADAAGVDSDWVGDYSVFTDGNPNSSITAPVVGAKESWSIADWAGPVAGLQVAAVVNIMNHGHLREVLYTVQPYLRVAGVSYAKPAYSPGYAPRVQVWETNPATGTLWGFGDLVAMEMGIERIS